MNPAWVVVAGSAGVLALCVTLLRLRGFARRMDELERKLLNATVGPNPYYRAAGEGDT